MQKTYWNGNKIGNTVNITKEETRKSIDGKIFDGDSLQDLNLNPEAKQSGHKQIHEIGMQNTIWLWRFSSLGTQKNIFTTKKKEGGKNQWNFQQLTTVYGLFFQESIGFSGICFH